MNNLKQIVYSAAKLLPKQYTNTGNIVKKGGKNNIATRFDTMIQDYIISTLKKYYPGATFLGEENLRSNGFNSEILFVIDPIDGTTNFVNNCKFSCISVAMLRYGIVQEAVIYNPYLDEMFFAQKNKGAWLNNKRILINDSALSESIVGFTNCPYDSKLTDGTFEFGKRIFKKSLDLRRMGASALEICYAACGRYQLYCEMILYPWDYLAASLVVREAGGIITDLNDNELRVDRRSSVVAGCPTAHNEVIDLYKQFIRETNFYPSVKMELF